MPKFTTGPIDNNTGTNSSSVVMLNALNNNNSQANVQVKVFDINSNRKKIFDSGIVTVDPKQGTGLGFIDVSGKNFEIQFDSDKANVRFSSWGLDFSGAYNPHHRVVHSELIILP